MQFNPDEWQDVDAKLASDAANEHSRLKEMPTGLIPTWSFSTLTNFEECPRKVYLSKIEGAPDPAGPAAQRGNQVHEAIEQFIKGEREDLCKEGAKHFGPLIHELRRKYTEGEVLVEEQWGHDKDWNPVTWEDENIWLKLLLDVFRWDSPTCATIIDWKTGRKFGNELKHNQQLQIYTLCAFKRFPQLEFVDGSMVYLDKNESLSAQYTREEATWFEDEWHRRGLSVTTAFEFDAYPSMQACRWCGHGKVQEGYDEPFCKDVWQPA